MSTAPLIDGYAPGALLGLHADGAWTAAEFLGRVGALASRLPGSAAGGFGLLLCEDRLGFALGLAASLWRRATVLLPPSHAPGALADLVRARRPRFALVDREGTIEGVEEIVVWPAIEAGEAVSDIPTVSLDHVAAIVYTSGTTGEPQPHAKTWGSLVRGAAALRTRIGFARGDSLVGAVPPQHMWGLEASVMLPLQSGGSIHPATPLLPQDIAAALRALEAPRWLVLTPLHARGCVQAGTDFPALAGVLSATAPLDQGLAAAFERLGRAPLIEIYGSSETGAIATRRPAVDERFTPLDGITMVAADNGFVVQGGHVDDPVAMRDQVAIDADHGFAWIGRDTDLVKVAGKRGSLAMLNRALRDIAGVHDGEFVVTAQGGMAQRLAALVVAPGLDRGAILNALRMRVDPVFLPRPLCFVAALPRDALGKVSAEALRRLVAEAVIASQIAKGKDERGGQ